MNNKFWSDDPEHDFPLIVKSFKDVRPLSWGVALILVGALLLLDNFNLLNIDVSNWWAIFILVPGCNNLARGFYIARKKGFSHRWAINNFIWGTFLVVLALSFFFSFATKLLFPALLVVFGLFLLIRR